MASSRPPPSAVPLIAITMGLGQSSTSRSSSWKSGGSTAWSHTARSSSRMSAPATNVRPAPVITTARTASSSARRVSTAARAVRTPRSSALTGGLSIVDDGHAVAPRNGHQVRHAHLLLLAFLGCGSRGRDERVAIVSWARPTGKYGWRSEHCVYLRRTSAARTRSRKHSFSTCCDATPSRARDVVRPAGSALQHG